jgi:hypothetical protein
MKELQDKVALVTGASSGIGQAVAARPGEDGASRWPAQPSVGSGTYTGARAVLGPTRGCRAWPGEPCRARVPVVLILGLKGQPEEHQPVAQRSRCVVVGFHLRKTQAPVQRQRFGLTNAGIEIHARVTLNTGLAYQLGC